ncbi:hypothetical protein HKX48_006343 [Thoreauomyces humboldtii]|nr:hypothetical protein HKX48_006343 [Thoreauomyces humboldtii]
MVSSSFLAVLPLLSLAAAAPLAKPSHSVNKVADVRLSTCPTYTVAAGDYCYEIGQKFGQTVAQLQAENPSLNCNTLQPGTVLCVGAGSAPAPAGVCKTYTVQTGDYCYAVATKFSQTVAQLQAENPTLDCNTLQPGQVLCVSAGKLPAPAPTPTPVTPSNPNGVCTTHTVVSGDSCYAIATSVKQTVAQLQAENPTLDCNTLQPGQILCVSAGKLPTPAPTATPVTPTNPNGVCTTHTVVSGDSCYAIATSVKQTVAQLQAENPTLDCNTLQPGQVLCVTAGKLPAPAPTATPLTPTNPNGVCTTHTVVSGDSCYAIATSVGQTVAQFQAENPTLDCNTLQPGQVVCVSAGKLPTSTPTPTPSPTTTTTSPTAPTATATPTHPSGPVGKCPTYSMFDGSVCWSSATSCVNTTSSQISCSSTGVAPSGYTSTCFGYQIVAGDSCDSIATTYGVSVGDLTADNANLDCGRVVVGNYICTNQPSPLT